MSACAKAEWKTPLDVRSKGISCRAASSIREGKPAEQMPALPGGHLNAIDLATRTVRWSFSRPTAEPNWLFGYVIPVDGALWVDSYQALIKRPHVRCSSN